MAPSMNTWFTTTRRMTVRACQRPAGMRSVPGLRQFYRKYRGRMTDDQRSAFIERSRDWFDCDPTTTVPSPSPTQPSLDDRHGSEGKLELLVGAITSPRVDNVAHLVDGLINKLGNRNDVSLEALLLENGLHDPTSREELRELVGMASHRGLDIEVKTLEQQEADARAGIFAINRDQLSNRKSIALARTMLQHYLFLKAHGGLRRCPPVQGLVATSPTPEDCLHTGVRWTNSLP